MDRKKFDIAIIGAGPGGYVAAIKLAQNGKRVCLIEKQFLGGSCLNVGCIPTKTLLASASVLHKVKMSQDFGISVGSISVDFAKMKQRKDAVVEKIRKSLQGLLQSNHIEIVHGSAEFVSPTELKVKGEQNLMVEANSFIVATGSEPLDIPAFPCDGKRILNSSSILELTVLPKTIAIIGGGYIGCEFASLYAELGVKVTILEALPSIVSLQGKTVSESLTSIFTKKGIDIQTGIAVESVKSHDNGALITLKDGKTLDVDLVLVSVGRKVVSHWLGLEKAGVKTGAKGEILVDDFMRTNVDGIYAIGDVTGKVLLAHVASHQGIVAASHILGQRSEMHYNAVPAVIFTEPEIATVGMTLEQATDAGHQTAVGKFPFQALGKSVATHDTDGFVQIITDKTTGQILGAQAIGHEASSLIAEITLAITNELTVESLQETIHAHPTLPEAWHEAALLAAGMPLHLPPRRVASK